MREGESACSFDDINFAVMVVQSLSHVQLFMSPWTAAHQAPLSSTFSRSWLKFMSSDSVLLSNHLILCHSLLLLPSIFPSIRIFSDESVLCIRWPKYWNTVHGESHMITMETRLRTDGFPGSQTIGLKSVVPASDKAQASKA